MQKGSAQERESPSGPNPLEIIRQKELELESNLKEAQEYAQRLKEQAQEEVRSTRLRTEEKISSLWVEAESRIKDERSQMKAESQRLLEQQKKEDTARAQENFQEAVKLVLEEVLPK